MLGHAVGGNDDLTRGDTSGGGKNILRGDATAMSGSSKGGKDILYAGTAASGEAERRSSFGVETTCHDVMH
jgi:hypothetical protein